MQQIIRCTNCGTSNTPNQKFCGRCGAPLSSSCANCGAALNPGDKFCGSCGAQMPGQSSPVQRPPQSPGYNPQKGGFYGAPQAPQGPPTQGPQPGWGTPQPGVPPPQPAWGAPPYQGPMAPNAPRGQSSSAWPLLILLVILIAALGGFAYWAFFVSPWSSAGDGGGGGGGGGIQPTTTTIITTTPTSVQVTLGPFIRANTDNSTPLRDISIYWETNLPVSGKVDYGADEKYGSFTSWETTASKQHNIPLTGLQPDMRYHYRITNKDQSGKETVSTDFTFRTPQ